jgi:hypothetical protein
MKKINRFMAYALSFLMFMSVFQAVPIVADTYDGGFCIAHVDDDFEVDITDEELLVFVEELQGLISENATDEEIDLYIFGFVFGLIDEITEEEKNMLFSILNNALIYGEEHNEFLRNLMDFFIELDFHVNAFNDLIFGDDFPELDEEGFEQFAFFINDEDVSNAVFEILEGFEFYEDDLTPLEKALEVFENEI